jgi:hypothetical protein
MRRTPDEYLTNDLNPHSPDDASFHFDSGAIQL